MIGPDSGRESMSHLCFRDHGCILPEYRFMFCFAHVAAFKISIHAERYRALRSLTLLDCIEPPA